MTSPGFDQLSQHGARRIVSAVVATGPGLLPGGVLDHAPRVVVTLDDGRHVELFSFHAHERSFAPEQFVGKTVDEARRLKFAPENRLDLRRPAAKNALN